MGEPRGFLTELFGDCSRFFLLVCPSLRCRFDHGKMALGHVGSRAWRALLLEQSQRNVAAVNAEGKRGRAVHSIVESPLAISIEDDLSATACSGGDRATKTVARWRAGIVLVELARRLCTRCVELSNLIEFA